MGARCCRRSAVSGAPFDDDLFEGNVYNTGRAGPQALFIGTQGAGKSTLLYSTLIPEWVEITTEMTPTMTVHYEQYRRGNMKLGMWEAGGSETMQTIWPWIWRLVAFDVVVFVVSALESDLSSSRRWIAHIVSEDELRNAVLLVVFNTFDQRLDDDSIDSLVSPLGLSELQKSMDNPQRLRWIVTNARAGERDPNWQQVLNWLPQVVQKEMSP